MDGGREDGKKEEERARLAFFPSKNCTTDVCSKKKMNPLTFFLPPPISCGKEVFWKPVKRGRRVEWAGRQHHLQIG